MSKKNVLLVAAVGSALFIFGFFYQILTHIDSTPGFGCLSNQIWCAGEAWRTLGLLFFHFPVILFFSLVTYKMNVEISGAWLKFTYAWALVVVAVLLLSLTAILSDLFWIAILPYLFAFISLVLIVLVKVKSFF